MDTHKDPETGTWTAVCDRTGCGTFTTTGHATKRDAEARMREHHAEHDAEDG